MANQLATHGGWLVLTSPDESVPALLAAGRRLARIWLRAEAFYCYHPMTQVLEEAPGPAGLGQRSGLVTCVQFVLRQGLCRKLRRAREPAPTGRVACAVCTLRSYCAGPWASGRGLLDKRHSFQGLSSG